MQYGWFFVAAITSASTINLVKQYTVSNDMKWLVFAFVLYILLLYSYVQLLNEKENLSVLYPMTKIMSILIVIAIAVLYYNETLEWKNIVGVLLGIIGIFLLNGK